MLRHYCKIFNLYLFELDVVEAEVREQVKNILLVLLDYIGMSL